MVFQTIVQSRAITDIWKISEAGSNVHTVYHLTRHLFITLQMLLSVTVIHPCAHVNVMIKGEYFKRKIYLELIIDKFQY